MLILRVNARKPTRHYQQPVTEDLSYQLEPATERGPSSATLVIVCAHSIERLKGLFEFRITYSKFMFRSLYFK
jgi:hypothetical protein